MISRRWLTETRTNFLREGTSKLQRSRKLVAGVGLSLAVVALSGCSVSLESAEDGSGQECTESADCATGSCQDGYCVSDGTELETVLLEITPSSGTREIAGVRFTSVLTNLVAGDRDIELGYVTRVRGVVRGRAVSSEKCLPQTSADVFEAPLDDSLPARVTWVPRERLLGLVNPVHTVRTRLVDGSYVLDANVPPGKYDLYVEPLPVAEGCVRPPLLVLDQEIEPGDLALNLKLDEPEVLDVHVRWPRQDDPFQGWSLDLIERDAGRILSNRAVLGAPTNSGDGLEYAVKLVSYGQPDTARRVSEIVRFSPPEDVVAPVIYVERSVVELFQDNYGIIDQLTELPAPVRFEGRVTQKNGTTPAPGTVKLMALELSALNPGTIAEFSRTATTGEDGVFVADVLPGKYRVIAEPSDPAFSQAEIEVTVTQGEGTQAGRVIEVPERAQVRGYISGFWADSYSGVVVQARSTVGSKSLGILDLARGLAPRVPRATSTSTDDDGAFSMGLDPGIFDVLVQPNPSEGLAWTVRRAVTVTDGDIDLGALENSAPYSVSGMLTSANVRAVPSALIRAYAYLKDGVLTADPSEATSVVQVGETRSDSSSRFRLLLPTRIE